MRAPVLIIALLASPLAQAQAPVPVGGAQAVNREPVSAGRTNQRVERTHVEDAGTRVDEVRYGGETQSIAVQPKTGLPEYQIKRDGARVWNLLKF